MKARILLLVAGIATFTSCTSLYKTGQTPDDVYYSPPRPMLLPQGDDYVQNNGDGTQYQSYQEYQDAYRDDRFLRLSIGNPYYLSEYNLYDGFDWRYNAYTFYGGSPWSNYWTWNNYYNPYTRCVVPVGGFSHLTYVKPVSRPIVFNGSSYHTISTQSYQMGPNGSYYNATPAQRYNNNNSYTPSRSGNSNYNQGTNNNTYTPSRSYTPSSAPSGGGSSGGGGGGGGGGVSRPTRP